MKIKEHSFISLICLLPLTLFLGLLLISGYLYGKFALFIFTACFISFWISFIFSLFFALDEITNSYYKKRIILLILFPFFYLPVFYTRYVYKEKNSFGFLPALLNFILIIGLLFSLKNYTYNYIHNKYLRENLHFYSYIK